MVHIDNRILLSLKKNEIMPVNMDGPTPTEYHTKQSLSERQLPYDVTYMWNLKYDANERI